MKAFKNDKYDILVKYLGKAETAYRLGYSRMALYNVEVGKTKPSDVLLRSIERVFREFQEELVNQGKLK